MDWREQRRILLERIHDLEKENKELKQHLCTECKRNIELLEEQKYE